MHFVLFLVVRKSLSFKISLTHEGVHETFCQSPALHLFSNVPLREPRCTGARKGQLLDILQQTGRARPSLNCLITQSLNAPWHRDELIQPNISKLIYAFMSPFIICFILTPVCQSCTVAVIMYQRNLETQDIA